MTPLRRPVSLALLGALLWCGCVQDPRPAPSADRDPVRAEVLRPPNTPLVRRDLRTQADFDALEESLLRRMAVGELIAVYTKLAVGAEPGADAAAALLLQRTALLHLRVGSRDGGFQDAFRVADTLRQQAPDSPHTQYLMGAITSLLMPPKPDGSYQIEPRRKDVALRLSQHWERLLRTDADYIGPSGRHAERIRRDLASLRVAIAATPDPTKPSTPAELLPGAGGEGAVGEPEPVAPAASPVTEVVNADEATAQQDLHRLDQGDTMARRLMCRDRRERPLEPSKTTLDVVRWVELRCALDLDEGDRALTWLAELVRSGAAKEPCRWLGRIQGGAAEGRSAVSEAMKAKGLTSCSP